LRTIVDKLVKRVAKQAALAIVYVAVRAYGLGARFPRLALAADEDYECSNGCECHDTTGGSGQNEERGTP
jgi:hypothetical protein